MHEYKGASKSCEKAENSKHKNYKSNADSFTTREVVTDEAKQLPGCRQNEAIKKLVEEKFQIELEDSKHNTLAAFAIFVLEHILNIIVKREVKKRNTVASFEDTFYLPSIECGRLRMMQTEDRLDYTYQEDEKLKYGSDQIMVGWRPYPDEKILLPVHVQGTQNIQYEQQSDQVSPSEPKSESIAFDNRPPKLSNPDTSLLKSSNSNPLRLPGSDNFSSDEISDVPDYTTEGVENVGTSTSDEMNDDESLQYSTQDSSSDSLDESKSDSKSSEMEVDKEQMSEATDLDSQNDNPDEKEWWEKEESDDEPGISSVPIHTNSQTDLKDFLNFSDGKFYIPQKYVQIIKDLKKEMTPQ